MSQRYRLGEEQVDLNINYFAYQRQGAEAISDISSLLGESQKWQQLSFVQSQVNLSGRSQPVNEMVIRKDSQAYLVWFWYSIGGETTNSRIVGKLLPPLLSNHQPKAVALGGRRDAAIIAIGAKVFDDIEQTEAVLEAFLRQSINSNETLVRVGTSATKTGTVLMDDSPAEDPTGETPKP